VFPPECPSPRLYPARQVDIHPIKGTYHSSRNADSENDGQQGEYPVGPFLAQEKVGVLEDLDALLALIKVAPEPGQVVADIAEVHLKVSLGIALRFLLQFYHNALYRPDDAALGSDISAQGGNILGSAQLIIEYLVLYLVQIGQGLVHHGETVVYQSIYDTVHKVARILAQILLANLFVLLAAIRQAGKGFQVAIVDGYHKVLAQEDSCLAGSGNAGGVVENREMEDDKKVAFILVNLGELNLAQTVVEVEGMKRIVLSQIVHLLPRRPFDIYPSKISQSNLIDTGLFFGYTWCSSLTTTLAAICWQPSLEHRKKIAQIVRIELLHLPITGNLKDRRTPLAL